MTRVARTYRLPETLVNQVESFADEHDMNRTDVVENALRDYIGRDPTSNLEEKVDRILDEVCGEGTSSEVGTPTSVEDGEKKKKKNTDGGIHAATPETSDASEWYDPEAGVSDSLSTDEIREVLKGDEPAIHPDDLDSLPRSTAEKSETIAAVVRYNGVYGGMGTQTHVNNIEAAIKEVVSGSDHTINTYLHKEPVTDHLYAFEFLGEDFARTSNDELWYLTEERQIQNITGNYEDVVEWLNAPLSERHRWSYDEMTHWLEEFEDDLVEHDVASTEQIDELKETAYERRRIVDEVLVAYNDHADSMVGAEREEVVSAVQTPEDDAEAVIDSLITMGKFTVEDGWLSIAESPDRHPDWHVEYNNYVE